ncbi:cobyrinate a,c-diamide synthase [Vibrio tapetis subsp. quintayensis]|uniref:cobyrinate a,c-diamide synthase n=1 Tax=Vibrio tapetis TaxID=52443 RepID=UPI0025B4FC0C|nr:cobyrinate a,c-diamide synthase [Vibrio tapetis]MDN3683118.1 cobyrinate a,c-diamide synthase [Vibrio tapetis subsp. quintayensis]
MNTKPDLQHCPALVVAAPSSGSGKTTVVAALARLLTQQGKKVRVFKTGPDFIDPQFLSLASKSPVYQLDLWMCGEDECRRLLAEAAVEADIILIEGVMGMFDGQCSSADIAAKFSIPILAVVDAGAMAQTFGALVHGLATYREDVTIFGVMANRVGSPRHAEMLQESLKPGVEFCGWLAKDTDLSLPERHLGLVQACELKDIEQRLDKAASALAEHGDIPLPDPIDFSFHVDVTNKDYSCALEGKTIAVAFDASFAFLYQANIDLLQEMGANIAYFSPLAGDTLPACDALYLPGGYPELNLTELANNAGLMAEINEHISQQKPCLAECGGMLYLNQSLSNKQGETQTLVGALNAKSEMQPKLAALGIVKAEFGAGKLTAGERNAGELRGHTFHYSKTISDEAVMVRPVSQYGRETDPVWYKHQTIASYIHWYFPSNPHVVAKMFNGELC